MITRSLKIQLLLYTLAALVTVTGVALMVLNMPEWALYLTLLVTLGCLAVFTVVSSKAMRELNRSMSRLQLALDSCSYGSNLLPASAPAVMVDCEECHVTETYPYGNDAVNSPHLAEHPERCQVVGVTAGAEA